MFKNIEAVHTAFAGFAPVGLREVIAPLLMQVSVLVPYADQNTVSLTFVGGTPIMSAELVWPIPPQPDDIEAIANRGGQNHSKYIQNALETKLPYSFIGQIDLNEVHDTDLPTSGRLLFFYDVAVGPWDNSTRSVKVIWDDSPPGQLVEFPPDETLIKAEENWNTDARAYIPKPLEIDKETRQLFLNSGLSEEEVNAIIDTEIKLPEHSDQRVYFGLKRMMQVETHYQTPLPFNFEWNNFAQAVVETYTENITVSELGDIYSESEIMYNYVAPFQVLGLPAPEQDDPRIYAAAKLLLGKQFPTFDEREEHRTELDQEARSLRLLFQASVADWLQESAEGTVYFLISDSDLKAHNFGAVIAVYQQT